jgi:thiol:disulfide interchange protein DsbC
MVSQHKIADENRRLEGGSKEDGMKRALLVLTLLVLAPALHAADPLAQVKELEIVKELFGSQAKILEARDLGSLYELVIADPKGSKQVFYLTKDGAYLLAGANLINREKVNLTKERYDEINRVDVSALPLQDAIEIKKGSGAKKLILFTDVDCPYCKTAYNWLKTQTDYTLYIFLMPLSMHPQAHDKSVKILCAKDREAALELAHSNQEITSDTCESGEKILERHQALAKKLGMEGTPQFVTGTGTRISGFQQQALQAYLKE